MHLNADDEAASRRSDLELSKADELGSRASFAPAPGLPSLVPASSARIMRPSFDFRVRAKQLADL